MAKTKNKIRVIIIDDHESILDGIEASISKNMGEYEFVFNSFVSGLSALDSIKKFDYDIYIVDLSLRDMAGDELIREIRGINPTSKIIVYTMTEALWDIKRLINMEVDGIVLKASASEELIGSIHHVLANKKYICKRFRYLSSSNNPRNPDSYFLDTSLSDIELNIIRLTAESYTAAEIAKQTGYAKSTIETYRKDLYTKLCVDSAPKLVAEAIRLGLLPKTN